MKANYLSRIVDHDDWKLNSRYFYMILLEWGPCEVDRMADNRNTQLKRLYSKFWCPNYEAVDCFTRDWSMTNNWICPPPYLVLMRLCQYTILLMQTFARSISLVEARSHNSVKFWLINSTLTLL